MNSIEDTHSKYIVSIDVGIKNLALCLLKYENNDKHTIESWDVIDLTQSPAQSPAQSIDIVYAHKCCGVNKSGKDKGKLCTKQPMFRSPSGEKYYCKVHSKSISPFPHIPTGFHKNIEKKTIPVLQKFCLQHLILLSGESESNNVKIKKSDYVNAVNTFIRTKCLQPIQNTLSNKTCGPSGKNISLIQVGQNMMIELDRLYYDKGYTIHTVIIENQISPIANRMKTLQGMITQYFIMRGVKHIEFISSSRKLSLPVQIPDIQPIEQNKPSSSKTSKKGYKTRKNLGIYWIQYWMKQFNEADTNNNQSPLIPYIGNGEKTQFNIATNFNTWNDIFANHKKKDDLADSYLQGLWYIYNQSISIQDKKQ